MQRHSGYTHGEWRIRLFRANRSCSSRTVMSEMGLLLGLGGLRKPGITPAVKLLRRGEVGKYLFIVACRKWWIKDFPFMHTPHWCLSCFAYAFICNLQQEGNINISYINESLYRAKSEL